MGLRRRSAQRDPNPEIVIVCEGKVTEPRYFSDFRRGSGNSLVTITAIGGCGVPVSVVERAVEEKMARLRTAKKTRDSFDLRFQIWAVFDRDAHPEEQVPRAIQMATEHGISLAYSNPCFEVWGLMHFGLFGRPGHHHDVQAELKRVLHGYCHETNPVIDVEALWPRYPDAVANATLALEARKNDDKPLGDPSTRVHLLTEQIRRYGKRR